MSGQTHTPQVSGVSGQGHAGAYGFRLQGLPGAQQWMQPPTADDPALRVVVTEAAPDHRRSSLDSDTADVSLLGGARLLAQRGRQLIRYALPERPSDADLLHPYLAAGAALVWQWQGSEALHAGVFATRAGAILLFGGKESGKSTTLAWLARNHDLPVLADDLAVIVDGQALAGPRCIDLRANGTPASGAVVRDGGHLRVSLPAVPSRLPVAGAAMLAWGEALKTSPVAPSERLSTLARCRTYHGLQPDEAALLELASLPMVMLVRPHEPDALPGAAEALLDRFW